MINLDELILQKINKSINDCVAFEAFGTPGVGKSYFCRSLQTQVSKKSNSIEYHFIDDYHKNPFLRKISKLFVILKSSWYRLDLLALACKLVFVYDDLTFSNRIKLIFNFLLVFSVINERSKKGKAILLDQGVFQGLWSCFFAKNTPTNKKKFNILKPLIFKLIDALDLELFVVLYISTTKKKIINGLKNRKIKGSSKLNSLEMTDIEKGIGTTLNMLDFIHYIVLSHPKIKLIEVPR